MKLEPILKELITRHMLNISLALRPYLLNTKAFPMVMSGGLPIRIHTDVGYVTCSKPFDSSLERSVLRLNSLLTKKKSSITETMN